MNKVAASALISREKIHGLAWPIFCSNTLGEHGARVAPNLVVQERQGCVPSLSLAGMLER